VLLLLPLLLLRAIWFARGDDGDDSCWARRARVDGGGVSGRAARRKVRRLSAVPAAVPAVAAARRGDSSRRAMRAVVLEVSGSVFGRKAPGRIAFLLRHSE